MQLKTLKEHTLRTETEKRYLEIELSRKGKTFGAPTSYDEDPLVRQLRAENLDIKGRLDTALSAMTINYNKVDS